MFEFGSTNRSFCFLTNSAAAAAADNDNVIDDVTGGFREGRPCSLGEMFRLTAVTVKPETRE